MSDIGQRLNILEKVAKTNAPDEGYKDIYPLMPLEFTNLIYKQGEPEQALVEIWHEVIDDYEQEHLDELHEYLKANVLPPWRQLVDLSDRRKNSASFDKRLHYDREHQKQELTKRALKLYERKKNKDEI